MLSVGLNNPNNVAFKAATETSSQDSKKEKVQNNEQRTYKTHAGLISGAVVGTVLGGLQLTVSAKSALLSLAAFSAAGAAVDAITNNKRENFAEASTGKTKNEIIKENDNAELSRTGELYHKTNVGKTYGTAIGAVTLPVLNELQMSCAGLKLLEGRGVMAAASAVTGAIGGLTLGAIADHFANSGAKKHADKMSISA